MRFLEEVEGRRTFPVEEVSVSPKNLQNIGVKRVFQFLRFSAFSFSSRCVCYSVETLLDMQNPSTQTTSNLKAIFAKTLRLRKSRYEVPKPSDTERPNLVRDIMLSKRETSSGFSKHTTKGTQRREERLSRSSHRTVSKCIARNLNSLIRSESRQMNKIRSVNKSREKMGYVQILRESRVRDRREYKQRERERMLHNNDEAKAYKMNVGNRLCSIDTKLMLDIEHKHNKNRAANVRHRLVKDQNFLEEKFSLQPHGSSCMMMGRKSPTAWSTCNDDNDFM